MENPMDIELPRLQALTEAKHHKKKSVDDAGSDPIKASTKQGDKSKQGAGIGKGKVAKDDKLVGAGKMPAKQAKTKVDADKIAGTKGGKAIPDSKDTKAGKGKGEKPGDPKAPAGAKKKSMPW